MTDRSQFAERLTETANELASVRGLASELKARLQVAEEVIRFYANPGNYTVKKENPLLMIELVNQTVVEDDAELSANSAKTAVAGLRARRYLKRYENSDLNS